ncbi:hypothetical protein L226DRAFT_535387 [Lentinus tigrinus ALCF2SS1-7]|uniref:Transcription elongation factor Eaf N-terminal domain-containing protein n=1 Tax=Lentinus tigrinus ALCF2SS1-6 TaxID=1328759 RepID=A0A5C2SDX6_9APHY|nr:hypothetical protein L227DRAFT_573883 [Lentinus tigrinus ALCF2SS1-6]RPD74509.1 hypothetical protein L226DRAFT_535387 [Lentinus tigrinus ALCF2SS1-7]
MATFANYPWTAGKHEVAIGNSLARTLKARKGVPVDAKAAKYSREFYSFRYNFKPESVDTTKAGTIEVKKTETGSSNVTVVRPSTQNEHGVNYTGTETNAREFDCVLIYDEQTGTFLLEKLDTMVVLQHDPKTVRTPRYAGSPAPVAPPQASASSSSSSAPPPPPEIAQRQEEEESEGEIPEPKAKAPSRPSVPARQPKAKQTAPPRLSSPKASAPAPAPSPKPAPAPRPVGRSVHGLPAKPSPTTAPAKSKTKPPASPIPPTPAETKPKRERPDEETLEIRRPGPPKKPKLAQAKKEAPPKQPVSLSFPDSSSAVSLPSTLAASAVPTAAQLPVPAPQPITTTAAVSDSEEEEWDEVPSTIAPVQPAVPPPVSAPVIEMEEIEFSLPASAPPPAPVPAPQADEPEGEEIDMDAFEEMLNDQLGGNPAEAEQEGEDEDDWLAGAVSPVAERQPLSLNQFAGGGVDFGDDDEYSSSDDSDDD